MTHVDVGVPVAVIQAVSQESVGEGGHRNGKFQMSAPDGRFGRSAGSRAVIECDRSYGRGYRSQRYTERVENVHLGICQRSFGDARVIRLGDETGECVGDGRRRSPRVLAYV